MFTPRQPRTEKKTIQTQAAMRSFISERHLLDSQNWVVSVVRRIGTEHAFLMLEGMNEEKTQVSLRSDLFLDKNTSFGKLLKKADNNVLSLLLQGSTSPSQQAFIRVCEMSEHDCRQLAGNNEHQSWDLTSQQAETLLTHFIEEGNRTMGYNPVGNSSLYSSSYSGSDYHNCVSWCREALRVIGIEVGHAYYPIQLPSQLLKASSQRSSR